MENEEMKDNNIAKEPEAIYQIQRTVDSKSDIPEYVWEDLKVGLEQYQRGEYISAENLLKRIKFGI